MTDKEKIRKEVEMVVNRRLNLLNGDYFDLNKEADGFTNEIMDIIDSLQEPVSDDLEEFALQYAGHHAPYDSCMQEVEDAVKAGAKWQKEHGEFAR